MITQKQENFVQNLFKGMTQRDSWIDAGYSSNYSLALVDTHACNLAKTDKIQTRLAELRGSVASTNIMSVTRRQERLSEIAEARLTDFVSVDGDSVTIDLEHEKNAALQEVSIESWRGGKDKRAESRTSKIKLINPIQAIAELNKMEHIYETGGGNTQNINVVFVIGRGYKDPPVIQEVEV